MSNFVSPSLLWGPALIQKLTLKTGLMTAPIWMIIWATRSRMIKLSLRVFLQVAAWLSTTDPSSSNLDQWDRKVLSLTSNRIIWWCQIYDYSISNKSRHPRLGCPFTEHMLQFICQFVSTVCTGDQAFSLLYYKRGGNSVTVCRQAPQRGGGFLLFVPLLLWKGYLKFLSKRENYTFLQIEVSISWPFS